MSVDEVTSINTKRFFLPAWAISLTLHGAVIGVALAFATQVKPILQQDLFQWDVALVEAAKSSVPSEPVESVTAPPQPMPKSVPQSRLKRVTEVSQVVSPPEKTIKPASSVEQHIETPQVREEPVEQRVVPGVEVVPVLEHPAPLADGLGRPCHLDEFGPGDETFDLWQLDTDLARAAHGHTLGGILRCRRCGDGHSGLAQRKAAGQPTPDVDGIVFDEDARLGVGGDWTAGGRVEGAFLSGLALAGRVLGLAEVPGLA